MTNNTNCTIVLLLLIIGIVATCKQEESKYEATMFRNSASHDGIYYSKAVTMRPSIKWRFETKGPIHSSAAVVDGKIFFGSGDSTLYCLDEKSGKKLWGFKTNGPIQSSPAVNNGIVYFGSHDGNFYALNGNSGEVKWQFKTAGEKYFSAPGIHGRLPKDSVFVDDWDFFLSSPTIDQGTIYFGSGSGYLYALDENTGNEKWKFKTDGIIHSSPALGLGRVYFGSWDTYFYALDKESGLEKWKVKTGIDTAIYNQTGFQGSPMLVDSLIYVGCRDSKLYAFNAITGEKKWERFNNYSWVGSSPVVYDKKLIYLTCDSEKLTALDKKTGDSVYSIFNKSMVFSSPALVEDQIYFGELNGFLTARNARNGKKIWTYQLESSQKNEYKILKPDSTLNYALVFSKAKQKEVGKTALNMIFAQGAIISSPVVKDQVIYVGSANGFFYAFQ